MLYTNINDPAYAYFGIFFSGTNENYCYYFGKTCDPQTYSFPFSGVVDTSEVKYKKIATADKHPTMTDAEKQMVTEINMVRYYPKVYAQIVARYLKNQGPIDKATYDAGISTRGHRYNLLNEKWRYVGCYYYESDNIPSKYQWIQNFGY